ncbi:MAG: hydrogenase nickel incorporation protein HypB [Bacteroidota bacterium]|nr:hydrogenase nickel incorporation protein HypB [Bacteroidota bacterium]
MAIITVERAVLKKNDDIAAENRGFFSEQSAFAINLLGSAGCGKTSILERTLEALKNKIRVAVIEGDVQTDNDARRIAAYDVPVAQIVTNGLCHLEAGLVQRALPELPTPLDLCIIENVGNLVCPAGYDLGEHVKVTVLSTTEGEDKPLKYPAVFRKSRVLIINKTDLLPYIPFDIERCHEYALRVNPELLVFRTSCTTGDGIDEWCRWLLANVENQRSS